MKIELSEEQVKQIVSIIANATVRVGEAPKVLELIKAIQTPAKEKKDVSP